jgi:hypothetical protein
MNTSRRIPRQLAKALAAGAVMIAAALPLAIATEAGAATITNIVFTVASGAVGNTIGTGAAGTFVITGTTFAGDGSNTTVTSTAPGMTFSGVSEANGATPNTGTSVSGSFATTSATIPGNYTVTVTDSSGPSTSTTTASGIVVVANAAITSVTPATPVTQSSPPVATVVTVTGTGFAANATVTFTNTTDGTVLTSGVATDTFAGGKDTTAISAGHGQGSAAVNGAFTTLTVTVYPTNSITGGGEAAGTYDVTVTNPNGGTTTAAGALTIIPYGVTGVSPSAVVPTSTSTNTSVTIAGAGFEPGALVTLTGGGVCATEVAVVSSSVVSATSITAVISEIGLTTALCGVTVANPLVGAGGNGASFALAGALGIGVVSTVAPTITATNATAATALVPGAAATTVMFTGIGFSQYDTTVVAHVGTGVTLGGVTLNNPSGNTGTAITFNVSAASGATAGPYNVSVQGSNAFPAAVSVAGPVITSQTPTGIAVGAPVGTVVTLTGTGFSNTTTGSIVSGGGSLNGIISYVSATTMNLVITVSPNAADLTGPPSVSLSQVPATGGTVISAPFKLKIDAAPIVTGLTYTVGSDVGVGAVAQQITIHGTGFAAGATVGNFKNGNGTVDANVTATVTSINAAGTAIVATVAIKAGDTNLADGYTVTNTDGGVATVPVSLTALIIGAGPTITAVSPATGLASSTNAFTITGTGFQTGASVAASSSGTCGSAAVVSATSITVSCTLGAASATPVTLIVTNVDGGSATSAAVLVATAPVAPGPRATGVHGHAVVGKSVILTISGVGFYGQPRITSTGPGVRAAVTKDSGHLLTVRVTVSKAGRKGWHTFTITNANGKHCKANYLTR